MPPAHPLPVIAGAYLTIIEAQADTKPVSNVFCWHVVPAPAESGEFANAVIVGAAVASRWGAVISDLLHTTYVGQQVKTYALGDPLAPPSITPMVANGGDTSAQHLLQAAGILKHNVIRRGKGSQSRTSLSPLGTDAITVNGDQVIDLWVTRADSNFADFRDGVQTAVSAATGGVCTMVQLSKQTFGDVYGKLFAIQDTNADHLIGSQKRRLGR